MTEPDHENTDIDSSAAHQLGSSDWQTRKRVADRLSRASSSELVSQVLDVFRESHRDFARLNAAIQVLTQTEVDVTPALLELYAEPDADLRAYVSLTLGERGDPRAIPALIRALADDNSNVQEHAIEALGKLRASAAVNALVEYIEAGNFSLAFPALDALAAIGDSHIVDRLYPSLRNPLLQLPTVETLGAIGNEESARQLLKLLEDSIVPPGLIAAAIERIHKRYVSLYGCGDAVADAVRAAINPATLTVLRSAIPSSTPEEAAALVTMIGWLPGDESLEVLLQCLGDPTVRSASIVALRERDDAVHEHLLNSLHRADQPTKIAIIELCGSRRATECVPDLLQLLEERDDEIVLAALAALAKIGDARAYAAVKSQLSSKVGRIRQAAVHALTAMQHPDTAAEAPTLFRHKDPFIRESAIKLAAYLNGPGAAEILLAGCNDEHERVRRTAVEHLPSLKDARGLDFLRSALTTDTAPVRAAAAEALANMDSEQAIPLLESALNDQDVWVRYFAVRSLASVDPSGDRAGRLASLALNDPAMQVRIAATEGLGRHPQIALPVLVQLAASEDSDLSAAALLVLGATRHPDALPILSTAVRSENQQTRRAAIRALAMTGFPAPTDALLQAARGRNQLDSDEAIAGLTSMKSIEALLRVAEIPSKREAVISALTEIGNDAVSTLACNLRSLEPDIRRVVVDALTRIRSNEAIQVLETVLEDPDSAVRHSAQSSVAHIHHGRSASRQRDRQ